jgi:FR47-like protein
MQHASLRDIKPIYAHFHSHRDVFPHVRQDTLRRRIEAHQCIWQDGVVITYQQYRKRTRVGDVEVPAGAIMLHQILNSNQFSGAGRRVFGQFVNDIVKPSGGDLYLSVRKENTVACRFYERHGMKIAGKVAWSGGTLSGLIYKLVLPRGEQLL